ncbi:MAG: phenylphosphate carboxylase subunit gamma [Chloroflexi bacterium]|nr:phenylphosphate carboxylase subunit gamma [Chloroflexota bacterium]
MKKEYVTFVRDFKSLPQGKEIEITIRDLTPGPRKYDAKIVKAVVSEDPARMPEGDLLWLRSATGVLSAKPWAIQVKGEVKGFLNLPPYSSLLRT